jgi:hypothetical protein
MYKHMKDEEGHQYPIRTPKHLPYDRQLYKQDTLREIQQGLEGGLEKTLKEPDKPQDGTLNPN